MRTTTAPIALAASALIAAGLLTGCTTQSSAGVGDACESVFTSGALSQNVSVLGEFGTEPMVEIPKGFTFTGAQAHTIQRADDRSSAVTEPSLVSMNYAIYESGQSSPLFSSESFTSGSGHEVVAVVPGAPQSVFPGGLACAAPGDRVLLTLSAEEAVALSGLSVSEEQTAFAVVVDVHGVQPVVPDGNVRNLPAGFPAVVTNAEGQPGVVATPSEAPTETLAAERIVGSGAEVTDDTVVIGNVMQVTWSGWQQNGSRSPLMNTYATQGPIEVGTTASSQHPVRAALTGSTVGSQVVVIMPDAEHGATITVVDILAGV